MIQSGLKIDYYGDNFVKNDIDVFAESRTYIENYFHRGSKLFALFKESNSLLLNEMRSTHMVFLYGLGAMIINNTSIKLQIEGKYEKLIPRDGIKFNNNALYYWFLVSLYHDIGYNHLYNDPVPYDLFARKSVIYKILKSQINQENKAIFQKYADQRYCYSDKERLNTEAITRNRYLNKKLQLNKYYCSSVYLTYNNKRTIELQQNCDANEPIEHGVYGGRLFFDNIIKTMIKSINEPNTITHSDYWLKDGLIWFPEQLDLFRDLALVIATHNIWGDSFLKYNIDSKFMIVNRKNPVLFLLCICDNLDIYKHLYYLNKNNPNKNLIIEDLMKSIKVTIENNLIILSSKQQVFEKLFCNIKKSIIEYIDVKVATRNNDGDYTIQVSF